MNDLTVRLRTGFGGLVPQVCDEAANEIEKLREHITRIAEAQNDNDWKLMGMYIREAAEDINA